MERLTRLWGIAALGLAALAASAQVSAPEAFEPAQPSERQVGSPSLLGLAEVPGLFRWWEQGLERPAAAPPTPIYGEPGTSVVVARLSKPDEIENLEYSYEGKGAVVLAIETRDGAQWFRVRLANATIGWLGPDDAGTYHPFEELVEQNLSYLNERWDGVLHRTPDLSTQAHRLRPEVRRTMGGKIFAEVVGAKRAGGQLWLEVEVMSNSPCEGEEPTILARGWLLAYDRDGEPVAWYYSRGC